MQTIAERDAAALLEVVGELECLDGPLAFPPRFLALLAPLVGSPGATYSVLDRRNARGVFLSGWYEGEEFVEVGHTEGAKWYQRLRHSHPLCSYRERTADWVSVHTVSDFATQREFHRTQIWNELYRHDRVNYWLDVGLPVHRGTTRVFIFTHESRDFDDRARLVLRLLEPHLLRRAHVAAASQEAVDALTMVAEAGDDANGVVLSTARGTIEFASERSRRLLARYFGTTNGRLPERLLGHLASRDTIVARTDSSRLTVRVARVDRLVVLLLGEDDDRVERLTPRQREILAGVADGLTDAEIGERLGIAAATVSKHLEAVYERLEVHKRTAAAALYRG